MRAVARLRCYWPEFLLALSVALPWISLLALGVVWLWQGDHFWQWALSALLLALLAMPLSWLVRRRANAQARLALGDIAEPSRDWTLRERDAWSDVTAIADATAPFTFTEPEKLIDMARSSVEAVARRFHPEAPEAWAQFSLPEVFLLAERVSRDVRHEALRHIPGIRNLRLSHLVWVRQQHERFGPIARTAWHVSHAAWRLGRAILNPLPAAGREASNILVDRAASNLSYRLRAYATRMLVLEIGRAAIDLYSGRLALSPEEIRAAQEQDAARSEEPIAPVRIVLIGQVNAGKSSLVNALAREIRSAVGPMPTTSRATEYLLAVEGRPAVSLVDMPGLGSPAGEDFLAHAERADIILWVTSAVQPARDLDRQSLDELRAWTGVERVRRTPPVLLSLTHVDQLHPANEWMPPYDIVRPMRPKARAIRGAVDAVVRSLDLPANAIVPIAVPPDRSPYNVDALWARIAVEVDEAKLVQLDRLRLGQRTSLREIAAQLGHAGRFLIKGLIDVR